MPHEFAKSDGKVRCRGCEIAWYRSKETGVWEDCAQHPTLAHAPTLPRFIEMVADELARARMLYDGRAVMTAFFEEAGETAKAYMDSPRADIVKEAVQTCAMAIRVALEGDPLMQGFREGRGLDK